MSGRLTRLPTGNFCIEYQRGVYVKWSPGDPANEVKPLNWIESALPGQEQVPENMVRTLIGSQACFLRQSRVTEKNIDMVGQLSDGGTITVAYVKGRPAQVMSEAECEEGIDILTTWIRSYLQSDFSQ